MNTEVMRLMSETIHAFRLPRYSELPNMGLYLEQVVKYINSTLAPLRCPEITGSMISNYVKKGLIEKPVKKQYYAEHVAYLIFIVLAKNLVTIEDIRLMISMQRRRYTPLVAYNYLADEMENVLYYISGLKDHLDNFGQTVSDEKDLLRDLIFSVAYMIRMNLFFVHMRTSDAEP